LDDRDLNAVASMIYRQLKRWISSRSRIVSVIVQPLLWIILLGLGFGAIFSAQNIDTSTWPSFVKINPELLKNIVSKYFTTLFGGVDYITYLITGMASMTAFMGSFISGISVIWDKQFGFLKETLVAPASRRSIIFGRMLGDAIINTIHSTAIILLSLLVSGSINIWGIPAALAYIFIMSLGFTGLGIALSLRFSSMEGFQMIVNLLTMPLMFMSGVFYPLKTMPDWMKTIALFNPLTYAVHGSRYWLTGTDTGLSFMNPLLDLAILSIFTTIFTTIAMILFDRASLED